MDTLLQDVRFALRNLGRTPTFPLTAIATLALGIGATTAIFSTVNAALLRPLPYPRAEDLYALKTTMTNGQITTGLLSPIELLRLSAPGMSIERAVGLLPRDVTLVRDDGTPLRFRVYGVSEGFFDLFGLPMTLGSGFTHEQFVSNGPPLTVISYQVWQDFFGGDRAIVGKPIHFAEVTSTIVGVAAKDLDVPRGASCWLSLPLDPQGVNHNFEAYMRLAPGTNVERTKSQMSAVMAELGRQFPASDASREYVVRPLVDSMTGDLGPILVVVLAATGLLLALACVNVANLLLARGAARAREMAVRVALGASRGRIVRQLLTESVLLAGAGGIVGVAMAYGGVRLLLAIGAGTLPRLEAVPFDARVLGFALATLLVSGVLVGFAPALRLAATDVKTLMNESGRAAAGGRATARWLNVMTVTEVALAIALVSGAGWLVRSFEHLWTTDPGFVTDGRVVFDVALPGVRYRDPIALVAAWHDLLERVRGIAGVVSVGATSNFPLTGSQDNSIYAQFHGEPADPRHPIGTRQRTVTPGFFDAMGIRLLGGRDFSIADRVNTTPVVVVNRAFAEHYLSGKDPYTTRFAVGYPIIDTRNELAIVGVVESVRQRTLNDPAEPAYYTVIDQTPARQMSVAVHTSLADTKPLQAAIRQEIHTLDPLIAVEIQSAVDIVGATLQRQRLGMTLMVIFGLVAVVLAAVGIYGVVAYATAQRNNEVATRLALGATQGQVFWLVLKQGRALTVLGAVIGVGLAYGSGKLVSSQVYAVSASDPVILTAAATLVIAIALLATTIPAFRASRLDPARVLRPE